MPTWPITPVPNSVDDVMPRVPIATFVPDQPGYEIRRRPGTTVRSVFTLNYNNLSLVNRNILRHFISNDINFGASEFDWSMPEINSLRVSNISTATITTAGPHFFTPGQWITLSNASSGNGNYRVASTASNTTLVCTGLSGSGSSGRIRSYLPKALIVLDGETSPGYDKIIGPIRDGYGLWNWVITIMGVNA